MNAPKSRIWFNNDGAIPSGFLANGLAYGPSLTRAGCFAVLYTSANCGYCTEQRPNWRNLVKRAQSLGCDAIRVAPARNEETPPGTALTLGRELVFLKPGWTGGAPPVLTPTLIIFARNAAEAWCHVGALDSTSTTQAVSALRDAAEASGSTRFSSATAPLKGAGGKALRCF